MEIGLYTFGELTPHWTDGRRIGAEQRLREILAAAKLADEAGFAVFAVGEHHRLDFSIAATPVVLAAIAQVTANVRLASAVTILPTADPVKVFEDFATVDLLSGGRAEVIAGRGVFTEVVPPVRLRPGGSGRAVRGKARSSAAAQRRRARHLAGPLSSRAARCADPAPPVARPIADLGWDWRNAGQRG